MFYTVTWIDCCGEYHEEFFSREDFMTDAACWTAVNRLARFLRPDMRGTVRVWDENGDMI